MEKKGCTTILMNVRKKALVDLKKILQYHLKLTRTW